jgi:catechol 2,3-dioxygenase-like lactoylglutathione lyase family enzyme
MTLLRMDNVLIVVDDLEAATAFFVELGMELEGEAPVEGRWVDRVVGLDDVRQNVAMDDIEDVLARLHTHGADLIGDLEQYEDRYRLCYVRGPEGIIVALAEQLS